MPAPRDDLPAELPPHDPAMERSALGAALMDPEACASVANLLRPSDFYGSAERRVFSAILDLHLAGSPVDQALVRAALDRAELLRTEARPQGLVTAGLLGQCVDECPTSAHAAVYAAQLAELGVKRRMAASAEALSRAAREPGRRAEDLLGEFRSGLEELERSGGAADLPRLSAAYGEVARRIEEGPPKDLLHPRGFEQLLELLPGRGLWPGLYVMGGPPGVGKTTLAMQLVDATLQEHPEAPVLYVTTEMTAADLFSSCVAREAEIDLLDLLGGRLDPAEKERAVSAAAAMGNRLRPVRVSRDRRVSRLRARAREMQPRLVVVDYFQQMTPEKDFAMAKDRVDAVAAELMLLRDELPRAPLVVLAAHSRGEGKRPYAPGRGLAGFKETGNIEYSSDRCLNLEYTEEEYKRWREVRMGRSVELNLVLVKNRMGRPGRVGVDFVGGIQRFVLGQARMFGPSPTGGGEDGDGTG